MKWYVLRGCWLSGLLLLLLQSPGAIAQKKSRVQKGFTEQQLIQRINACLGNEDPYCYISLFPDMDTLSKLVMAYSEPGSKDYQDMASLQQDPVRIMHADSVFHARLKQSFDDLIAQGKLIGIHWSSIIPVRYELVKAFQTRNQLYEKLAPTRFTGYLFVMDGVSRKTYGFTVSEMLQLKEEWYGGYLGPVYEAGSKDEYEDQRLEAKRQQKAGKSIAQAVPAEKEEGEEEENKVQKMIAERKLYIGMFDNEIPVQLYVRSLKGTCKEGVCSWEAIYKFGDQDDYILLNVTRTPEGAWTFTEDPPTGSMELTLKGDKYTGNWTSADNQTGYEVKLTEAPASGKKIERLDAAFLHLRSTGKD